ncbi:camp-binding domain-like protein, partial [Gonapodya prolifera JEL478]
MQESTAVATEVDVVREKLKSVDLFRNSGVDVGVLHEIALRMKIVVVKPGEPVVRKGDRGKSMFFVVEGLAEVVSEDGFKTYAQMRGGSFFGEVALFYDVARTATVLVREECTLLELHKEELMHVLSKYPLVEEAVRQVTDENYQLYLVREQREKNARTRTAEPEAYGLEASAANLKNITLFSRCSESFLRQLALGTEICMFDPGDIVISKGDPA